MPDSQITDLNELLSLSDDDITVVIDDSEGNLAIKGKYVKLGTIKNWVAASLGTGDIKFPVQQISSDKTLVTANDNGKLFLCNNVSDLTITIPNLTNPTVSGNEFEFQVLKVGTGKVIIEPHSSDKIGNQDAGVSIENDYGADGVAALIHLKAAQTDRLAVVGGFKKWLVTGTSTIFNFSEGGGISGSNVTSSTSDTILVDGNYRHNTNASPQTSTTITFSGTGATGGVGGTMYHQTATAPTFSASNGLTGANILKAQNYKYIVDVINIITWIYDGLNIIITNVVGGNSAPYATGLSVTGTEVVGNILSANYTYNDSDGDLEDTGSTAYKWYRANSDETGQTEIAGATSANYTTTVSDEDKINGFAVKLYAQDGVTEGAYSEIVWSGVIAAAGAASDYELEAEGNYTVDTETGSNGSISELDAIGASGNKIVSLPDVNDMIDVEFTGVTAANYEIWVLARAGTQPNPTAYNGSIDIVYNSIDRAYTLDESTIGGEVNVLGSSVFGYFKTDSAYALSGDVTISVRANYAWSAVDAILLKYIS